MKQLRRLAILTAFLGAAVTLAPRAQAYDSLCRVPSNPESTSVSGLGLGTDDCPEGPAAAQGRFRVSETPALDEHRQILESAMQAAGLPAKALETVDLPVYAATTEITSVQHFFGSDETIHSVAPVPVDTATRVMHRRYTVDELAQLPDFSYSLWDWANGNEDCPLGDGSDPITCHSFTSHMGAANSNHFVPQATNFYRRLHAMAIARAGECKAMHEAIGSAHEEEFRSYLEQCEYEALTIEAEAQHFLQDSWSSGHMWERWGSTDLQAFPNFDFSAGISENTQKLIIADTVAAISGLIHGAEALLHTCDRMCCPDDNTRFVQGNGSPEPMAGDIHLNTVDGRPGVLSASYSAQRDRLTGCTAASVRQVYDALGAHPMLGDAGTPSAGAGIDPTGDFCHGGRATNKAMLDAMAVDNVPIVGTITFNSAIRAGRWIVRVGSSGTSTLMPDTGIDEMADDLLHLYHAAQFSALINPTGTNTAALRNFAGQEMVLLGVHPNSYYADEANTAPYQDPDLPWAEGGGDNQSILARAYHRGHATEWCQTMTPELLDALRSHATESADRMEICKEFAKRHLRRGDGIDCPYTGPEPLCHYLSPDAGYIYQPAGMSDDAAAEQWCRRPASDMAATARGDSCGEPDPCEMAGMDCASCNAMEGCGFCPGHGCKSDVPNRTACGAAWLDSPGSCYDCSGYGDCTSCANDGHCGWCPGSGCLNVDTGAAAMCSGFARDPFTCGP